MLVPSTLTGWYRKTTIMIAVPIAKKTSRAHPRISPTRFDSVALPVSGAETCSSSGSVVIRMLLEGPLQENGSVSLADSPSHFQRLDSFDSFVRLGTSHKKAQKDTE